MIDHFALCLCVRFVIAFPVITDIWWLEIQATQKFPGGSRICVIGTFQEESAAAQKLISPRLRYLGGAKSLPQLVCDSQVEMFNDRIIWRDGEVLQAVKRWFHKDIRF